MRRFLLAASLLACAGPSAEQQAPPAPTKLAAAPPRAFDAHGFAATQLTPAECEAAARRVHDDNPADGWAALVACIDRPRWQRGDFTLLQHLTSGFWDAELQTKPEVPRLLARVMALRGGDVEGDIPMVQKSRAPLFTLAAAMKQPDVYKGRYVVVRGALSDVRVDSGQATALLAETSLRATSREVQVGPSYRSDSSRSFSGQAEVRTSSFGSGQAVASTQHSSRSESSVVKQKFENERAMTGREAVGKLPQADPFLEPEKDFVFLARFDGLRPVHDEEKPVAVLTILGYYRPNALLIE